MNKLLFLLLAAPALYAQIQVTKVVPVHNFPAEKIANLITGNVTARGDNLLNAVVLRGAPDGVAEAEQTIAQLDQHHSSGVEITAYIIGGSNKSQTSPPVGKELEPVVKQLAAMFAYGSYELLDTVLLRSTTGSSARADGSLKLPGGVASNASYIVSYRVEPVALASSHASIALSNFQFKAFVRDGDQPGLSTDLDIQPGQKIVVGKTNVDHGESALFVVLTARLLDSEH